jgi:3-oxoacyl-[acyl-carrier-protein] synthase II
MGVVSCLGSGLEANWAALCEGRSGIAPITLFDASAFKTRIAGEVRGNFDPTGYVNPKELRRMDRFQQFTLVAASEAMADAGIETPPKEPFRAGVVIGSGMGGLTTMEGGMDTLRAKGPEGPYPLTLIKVVINLAPGLLAIRFGFKGPNFGLVNACASGASAIGEAYRIVREGRADVMLTGGSEAVVTELSVAAFNKLRALSTKNGDPTTASRPFDKDRDGFVISEGAGILVLESEDHARMRGARIHGEIVGYGSTDDAYHVVMPDTEAEAPYWAMKIATEDAGIPPNRIDYINAHGTSTELNDKMETLAIKKLMGPDAYRVSISSTKSMTGHLIGAAGAVEAIFTLQTLKTGIIPPTINLDHPDPECDLDYTPHKSVHKDLEYAASNSFAFGGQNASLVFRRYDSR